MPIRSKRVAQRGNKVSRKRNRKTKRGKVVIRSRKGGANSNSVNVPKDQLQALDDMITQHAEEMKVVGLLGASRIINNLLSKNETESASPELSVNDNMMKSAQPVDAMKALENENVNNGLSMNSENMESPEPVSGNLEENTGLSNTSVNMESPEPVSENLEENMGLSNNSVNMDSPEPVTGNPKNNKNMTLDDVTPESPSENEESPSESQVGGYYKRFIKSKKNNKKSVML